MNLSTIIKEAEERLSDFIGEAPKMVESYEKQVCFVCCQPFNKSEQVDKLKKLLSQELRNLAEDMAKEITDEIKKDKFSGISISISRVEKIINEIITKSNNA